MQGMSEGVQSFTISYFNKRTTKLMENQRKVMLAKAQMRPGQVESSGGGQEKLAKRLFFHSTQMELDVDGLLQAAWHSPPGPDGAEAALESKEKPDVQDAAGLSKAPLTAPPGGSQQQPGGP